MANVSALINNRCLTGKQRNSIMLRAILFTLVTYFLIGCASSTRPGVVGVTREQLMIVPAADVERMAAVQYVDQISKAKSAGRLITEGQEYDRLRKIGARLIRQSVVFRDDIKQWKWNLTLIDAPVLNATCAPGGKITFCTGIIRQLSLTDDEIATIMGHEIAHALREHGREKVSEAMGQQLVVNLAAASSSKPEQTLYLANQVAQVLYALPNSREKETEADRIGLELMARAGYNPIAAVSVWRKMAVASKGQSSPQFLSTHPSHGARINDLSALQPLVRPLYDAAPKP